MRLMLYVRDHDVMIVAPRIIQPIGFLHMYVLVRVLSSSVLVLEQYLHNRHPAYTPTPGSPPV